jgi:membrane fusion protein, multidrug efflux system
LKLNWMLPEAQRQKIKHLVRQKAGPLYDKIVRDLRSIKWHKGIARELWHDSERRWIPQTLLALVILLTGRWIYSEFTTETTDDAFISSHVHVISSRINGTITEVPIKDNQVVKKGDVLVRLDKRDYEIQQKIAEARDAKAQFNFKKWGNQENLHPNELLQKNMDQADAAAFEAAHKQAVLNLLYTDIVAPEDGKVGNRAVETGQQVQSGQALMALVEQTPWVVANFKEGQAAKMKPGQEADIYVDAIPGHEFHGHVDSVAPGSGATFSLLPPDNATGNFTKIVQRIPVKIVFEADSIKGYEDRLVAGMSTTVTVYR